MSRRSINVQICIDEDLLKITNKRAVPCSFLVWPSLAVPSAL